jgi:alkylated DNA repair protein (DNA oxidative demethylase)
LSTNLSSSGIDSIEIAVGVKLWPQMLSLNEQRELMCAVLDLVSNAPFYRPVMPRSGRQFSVDETNFGSLGWYSDRDGYRYIDHHPVTASPWPPIPDQLTALWKRVAPAAALPECCLVNLYRQGAKMGLHQDRDEEALDAPVVSVSLGDDAVFRIGGTSRKDPTRATALSSGDVVVFGGPARLAFHGIDGVREGTSPLVPGGGRINLTLRRVRTGNDERTKKAPDQGADRAPYAPLRAGAGRG